MGTNSSKKSQSKKEDLNEPQSNKEDLREPQSKKEDLHKIQSRKDYLEEDFQLQKEIEPDNPDLSTQEKLSQLKALNKTIFSKPLSNISHYECLMEPDYYGTGLFNLYLHSDSTFDLIGLRIIQTDNEQQEHHFHFVGVYTHEDMKINFYIGLQAAYIKQTQSIPTQ